MPRPRLNRPKFTLARRDDSAKWYVRWTEQGKTQRLSTGTTDADAAKRFLAQFEAGWATPGNSQEITVTAVVDEYLSYKKESMREGKRVIQYRDITRSLRPIKEELGHLYVSDIPRPVIRGYIKKKQDAGYSDGTTRRSLALFTAALNHVFKEGWIEKVPFIDKPEPPAPKERIATPEELQKFFEQLETPHLILFCQIALHTLSRATAILELTWDRADLENRLLRFNPVGRRQTSKRRVPVPINDTLLASLIEAKKSARSDHVIEFSGSSVLSIRGAFRNAARSAKMEWLTPHILRHTGATMLARAGVDMLRIAGMMGDTLATVEKHYLKHHPSYLKEAASGLDEVYKNINVPTGTKTSRKADKGDKIRPKAKAHM